MNTETFKKLLREKPISVIYFSYPECSVCKSLRPKIEEFLKNYDDVFYSYLNTEEHPELAAQNNIFSVPTIVIYAEGKETKRWSRVFSISEIEAYLTRLNNPMH